MVSRPIENIIYKKKILVIEDNHDLASLYEFNFEISGYKTLVAYDGRAGLLAARLYQPDGIVLDRGLHDMDGRKVCRKLLDAGYQGPILFMTGRKGDAECILCLKCDASTLIKTAPIGMLIKQMGILLSRRKRVNAPPPPP